jgi:HSP20 family molecular chaperone IbpA
MPNVAVNRIADVGNGPAQLLDQIQNYFERIRQKAFEIFEKNGAAHGHDVEQWLEAEREIRGRSILEITENEGRFELTVAAPSIEPGAIEVSAFPDLIVVSEKTAQREEKVQAGVRLPGSRVERLFYCVTLPEPLDVDSASATLEKGVLRILAQKASRPKQARVAA